MYPQSPCRGQPATRFFALSGRVLDHFIGLRTRGGHGRVRLGRAWTELPPPKGGRLQVLRASIADGPALSTWVLRVGVPAASSRVSELTLDAVGDVRKRLGVGAVDALGLDIKLMDYHEHAIGHGANAKAACYVELRLDNGPTLFGAGIDSNIVTASFKAVLSAVNRQLRQKEAAPAQASDAAA